MTPATVAFAAAALSAATAPAASKVSTPASVVANTNPADTKAREKAAATAVDPSFQERKRQLLLDARRERVDWIRAAGTLPYDASAAAATTDSGSGESGNDDDGNPLNELCACATDALPCAPAVVEALYGGGGGGSGGRFSDDAAPEVRERIRLKMEEFMVREGLAPDSVRRSCRDLDGDDDDRSKKTVKQDYLGNSDGGGSAGVPAALPSTSSYETFLDALSRPECAEAVLATRKFVATVEEASSVMVKVSEERRRKEQQANKGGEDVEEAGAATVPNHAANLARAVRGFLNKTFLDLEYHLIFADTGKGKASAAEAANNGGEGDEKSGKGTGESQAPSTEGERDPAAAIIPREVLLACLETFVFAKCRRAIGGVIASEDDGEEDDNNGRRKTIQEADEELHEKLGCLQFVTPTHLEISCLKSKGDNDTDNAAATTEGESAAGIDLSEPVRHLRDIERQRSPRQMLRCILLAHRGIHASLTDAVELRHRSRRPRDPVVDVVNGTGSSETGDHDNAGDPRAAATPPGADDVLPALILAVIRSRTPNLVSSLRFVEIFSPGSFRGEAGYAFTNLCGAVHFLKRLDLEGHAREVSLAGGLAEDATLSIRPEEFREGLARCRERMKVEEEEKRRRSRVRENARGGGSKAALGRSSAEEDDGVDGFPACFGTEEGEDGEGSAASSVNISAREVRDARTRGEVIDLDWAIRRREDPLLEVGGGVAAAAAAGPASTSSTTKAATRKRRDGRSHPNGPELRLPPEAPPLPEGFARSYGFVATNPDDVRVSDLPHLLKEYRMLVRATEMLLSERTAWRESERKRHIRWTRDKLESSYEAEINNMPLDKNGKNGFGKKRNDAK